MRLFMSIKKISFTFLTVIVFTLFNCGGSKQTLQSDKISADKNIKAKKKLPVILAKPLIVDKTCDEAFPSTSFDGNFIAYQKKIPNGKWEIWFYDTKLDSSYLFFKTSGNLETPKFSNDGTKLVFTSDQDGLNYEDKNKSRDIFIISLASKTATKITNSDCDNWNPSFANNDSIVVFNSNINDSEQNFYKEKASFFSYSLTSKKTEEVLPSLEYKNMSLFSHNFKKIVYCDEENKLTILDLATNKKRNITPNGYISGHPSFSNDDSQIFYHNFKNDKYEIWKYIVEKDSSAVVVKSLKNARAPFVNKNKVYFHSNQNGTYDIFEADLK